MIKKPTNAKKRINWELFCRFLDKDNTYSPMLLLISMLLILAFKIATSVFPDKASGYLGYLILQLIIFFVPAYLYSKFTSKGKLSLSVKDFKLKPPSIDHTFLILSSMVLVCALVFIFDILFRLRRGYPEGFYLYNTFFTGEIPEPDTFVYPMLTFALAPAVCEEFVFRGIIHRSYEKKGYLVAAILSSIMYALVTFDISLIPASLVFGLFMSFMLYMTDSLAACIIINFAYKMFMLFFGTNMANYLLTGGNNFILFSVVIGALLLSLCIFAFECTRIFKGRAEENRQAPVLCRGGIKTLWEKLSCALFTMCIVICVGIFIIFNVINIFL